MGKLCVCWLSHFPCTATGWRRPDLKRPLSSWSSTWRRWVRPGNVSQCVKRRCLILGGGGGGGQANVMLLQCRVCFLVGGGRGGANESCCCSVMFEGGGGKWVMLLGGGKWVMLLQCHVGGGGGANKSCCYSVMFGGGGKWVMLLGGGGANESCCCSVMFEGGGGQMSPAAIVSCLKGGGGGKCHAAAVSCFLLGGGGGGWVMLLQCHAWGRGANESFYSVMCGGGGANESCCYSVMFEKGGVGKWVMLLQCHAWGRGANESFYSVMLGGGGKWVILLWVSGGEKGVCANESSCCSVMFEGREWDAAAMACLKGGSHAAASESYCWGEEGGKWVMLPQCHIVNEIFGAVFAYLAVQNGFQVFCIVFVLSYKRFLAFKHFVSLIFSFQHERSTLFQTVQLLESSQDNSGQEAVEGYLSLARFADTQYQNVVNYMNSPTFEAKQALMNKAAAEYQKYSTSAGGQVQKELSQQLFAWYISLYSIWSETPSGVLWESTAFCLVHLSVQFMVRNPK